jgi:polysaccharide export outer membrane protein
MRRCSLFLLLAFALSNAGFAQSSSAFPPAAGRTSASLPPLTVEKPAQPVVRRAEPVNRSVEAVPIPGSAGAVFRPGDTIELRMTGMPLEDSNMYNGTYTLGGDGLINVPLAGQVRAAGLTQGQLEKAIEKRLVDEKIFRWPTATINVPNQARFVTVGGNVRGPSRLVWSPDLTLLAAISACGGVGDFGGDKVNLIRNGGVTTLSIKKLKRNPVDDPKLLPGDQVDLL